ncbi:hypothetical protein [Paenibacillus sp. KR2-11]|uniref:hypothetical protein n=1 Tax=Paenibacillus sp. KR2-11 TaxID=3385500 RepID=UPI0038FC8AD2
MAFRVRFPIPENMSWVRLKDYCSELGLNRDIIIWELEEDSHVLGNVNMVDPPVIEIKPTDDISRLEGRIAHEITHVSLELHGYRNLAEHSEPIKNEVKYISFLNQFANLLHHQVLYPRLSAIGFSLADDMDLVQSYYAAPANVQQMRQAYYSGERFAKAWVVVSIMNDLIRLPDNRHRLVNLITPDLMDALNDSQEILQEIGVVNTLEKYGQSKVIIEQRLGIPSFDYYIE